MHRLTNSYAELEAKHQALALFRSPWWLRSAHGSNRLVVDFGGNRQCEVNLDIALPCGRRLADSRKLVEDIYDYICCQSITKRGERSRDEVASWKHLIYSLNVVDYFLLHDVDGHLAQHGFGALGTPSLNRFLLDVAKHQTTAEAIYGWSTRVKSFLLHEARNLAKDAFEDALVKAPHLATFDLEPAKWTLTKEKSELLRVRAVLWAQGAYQYREARTSPYRLVPSSSQLAQQIFAKTLYGPLASFPGIASTFPELCVHPTVGYRRERAAVAVWAGVGDPRCDARRFRLFKRKLADFLPLSRIGTGPRLDVLEHILAVDFEKLDEVDLKQGDGVQPASPSAVAHALRESIEFFYSHGDHLLTSSARVLLAARSAGVPPWQLAPSEFQGLLAEATKEMGIDCWSIREQLKLEDGCPASQERYLGALRQQRRGLWDMTVCLYGACQITVGVTQAARNGELMDLTGADIEQPGWLRLLTRKSHWGSARYQDYRPMPEVTENILQRLHGFLRSIGFSGAALFRYPSFSGALTPSHAAASAAATDLFLDFIEAECDAEGRRYYLRQHQLRQFFAEAFFYCFGLKGLEALRWFLRHLDPEQLWEYVEHTTPGAVLRRHKAAVAVTLLREQSSDLERLAGLLQKRFRVRHLEVLNDAELEELIVDLLREGTVRISPVFAKTRRFEDMRLAVIVHAD